MILAGCTSPSDKVKSIASELATDYQQHVVAHRTRPVQTLDWPAALALMRVHNLELQQSRDAVTTAEENYRQINRDLIPGVAITANLTKALTDLGNLRGEDAALSIYGFFNLPGAFQWHMRRYSGELQLIRTRWAEELKQRELSIQLRELFLRSQLLNQRHEQLERSRRWQTTDPLFKSLETTAPQLERETLLHSLRMESETLQDSIAKLLGTSSCQWQLQSESLPRLEYLVTELDLADTARFGGLYRRLQAIELEGARLRQRGIKLQSWPDLQINLSAPPLYQSSGSASPSASDIRLTLSSSLPLDLRGSLSQQLRQTKRDFARLESRLRQQNNQTIAALHRAQESLRLNNRQLRLTELRLDALSRLPLLTNPHHTRENLKLLLALDQQRTNLLLEKNHLEALFWILDESRWPATTTP